MSPKPQRYAKYIKLLLYLFVVVLVNLAGLTLFFRLDLTRNKSYSLSEASRNVVATLSEPLTVKVFFTKDLPAPYNNTQRYLQDLLNEYALQNKKYFKPQIYNVNPDSETIGDDTQDNREMARNYGIFPVQIQMVDNDEVKFKHAFMGLVLIHGDTIERIPTITSTDGLEYQLTTAIQKLNHKVSALLNLEEKIQINLVLSSSFYQIAPVMGLAALPTYPEKIKKIVDELNTKNYNQLVFRHLDPSTDAETAKEMEGLDIMHRVWPDIPKANVTAGKGSIGLFLKYKQAVRTIPLLQEFKLPIFGTQYQLADVEAVKEAIETNIERLLNINEAVGYLADYGTLSPSSPDPRGARDGDTIGSFKAIMDKTYSLSPVHLKEEPFPDGLQCLVIPRPTEKLSDYALYQIDQALMHGTNLAIFMDAFKETGPPGQMPNFVPMDTGLEKMLAHYGVRITPSLVLDENCYRQRMPQNQGGGEQPLYFAPIIQNQHINKDLAYIKNIKGLIVLKISPLELDQERIGAQHLIAHQLLASSTRSWQMRDRINLNPMFMRPPAQDKEMASLPLAYLLEGSFSSYFAGKPIPQKPAQEESAADPSGAKAPAEKTAAMNDLSKISGQSVTKEQSVPAKIFVVASSEMLKDQLLDPTGKGANAMFLLNVIDALNNREAIATMRSKAQQYNPLVETGAVTKLFIKAANIVGLPLLVIFFGLLVWYRRHARKKKIELKFQGVAESS
jgi:ABC-2 type transport system permease protein